MLNGGYTYIVTDRPFGVLYTGVTANIGARISAHRKGTGSKFTRKWECARLVLVEHHESIDAAIARERR